LTPASVGTHTFPFLGSQPVISANGNTNGILWTLEDAGTSISPVAGILHAYNALNLAQELYNSNQNGTHDVPGLAVKFAVPTVANGKVYVGSTTELDVYGLTGAGSTPTPTPTATPTPGSGGPITVRSTAIGSTSGGSSQVTIPVPAGVLAHDVMIAQVTVRGGAATTLTAPAGWSLVRRDNDSSGQIAEGIYVRVVTAAAEPASYTWTFPAGNDAAGGIAAYIGVNTAAPIDVSNGQGNAASTNITAPSVTIPAGHNADRLLALFAIPDSSAMTLPAAITKRWSLHAIGWGISAAMGDASVPSGATGNYVASQGTTSTTNVGALIALQPAG
jgi:hypothetical protein